MNVLRGNVLDRLTQLQEVLSSVFEPEIEPVGPVVERDQEVHGALVVPLLGENVTDLCPKSPISYQLQYTKIPIFSSVR